MNDHFKEEWVAPEGCTDVEAFEHYLNHYSPAVFSVYYNNPAARPSVDHKSLAITTGSFERRDNAFYGYGGNVIISTQEDRELHFMHDIEATTTTIVLRPYTLAERKEVEVRCKHLYSTGWKMPYVPYMTLAIYTPEGTYIDINA